MAQVRGLPLLSGPAPTAPESGDSCRKCNKEFNMFINRSRKCNHCGYLYCHNCSDYTAMMPRGGQEAGYDPMNVCAFCIEFLNITAAGRGHLRTLPLSKLKKYVDAYNIKMDRAVEKDDLIDGMLKARNSNGCLSRENENFYRKYSVPNRSTPHTRSRLFSRAGQSSNATPQPQPPQRPASSRPAHFPRPDLAPDNPHPHTQYRPPPGPPPQQYNYNRYPPPPPVPPRPQYHQPPPQPQHHLHPGYAPNPHHYSHPPTPSHASRPQQQGYPQYQRPSAARSSENLHHPNTNTSPPPPRARAASAAPPVAVPPPTLDELLDMPTEAIASLSIGALKSILFRNHVNAGLILEKGELVAKVKVLVEDERGDRERQRAQEEAEEAERIEIQRQMLEEHARVQREREERFKAGQDAQAQAEARGPDEGEGGSRSGEGGASEGGEERQDGQMRENTTESSSTSSPPPKAPPMTPPKTRGTAADLERTGLCVVCQDDEANIAIVDCGHLAMCRGCSELVMASSRECPLCRTRIVTEARLLRIFKT
ncbi:hypothetical protein D9615_005854 [Tricholomella constricta]|uniref:RING-type domain-containing protein n=1 Tax=Tricholomella constricta TaxID=117010 RepID=A0A8H5M381_9AGAR|nr:hypothetical protein D9615_005854 [Tricholomella constricta]